MAMVYVIFAKDEKEYQRTLVELTNQHGMPQNHDAKLCVHAANKVHLLHLKDTLQKRISQGSSYKNPLTLVYSPQALTTDVVKCKEHDELIELYNKHLVPASTFFSIKIEEFIKTAQELAEEEEKKRKDMKDWFVGKMRTLTNR